MSHRAQTPSLVVLLIVLTTAAVALAGCIPPRRPIPFTPPNARALAPADDPSCGCGPTVSFAGESCPMRRPRQVLVLSGGGAYGAYTAGFLAGWTHSGTRPEFDVVTGISTGALIAPLAFLGPEFDCHLGNLYTRVQASDVFRIRAWVTIPFKDAAASSAPLKQLIEAEITQEMMNRVAAEHRKGRRLYVGTTNLDTRRLVIWDMGAIACRPCPEGCALFRDVLLASCSVRGVFPPVRFDVEVDGRQATELHVDGGVTAQLFVPSPVFAAAAQGAIEDAARPAADPMPPAGNLYVLVAGKLYPDAAPVRPLVLPVLGASANSVIYAHCRAELANLYGLSRAAGLQYHLTALRQEFPPLDTSVSFDPQDLNQLYAEGGRQGASGPVWMSGPPTLCPGDGDYIRTGVKLRTPLGEPLVPIPGGN
ncbi:MAG TPA: patatin-like phospholipase family protein [Gemmataceae bacterium]|nr:patatin-like phospholipase family protein [Gemmataceae bacterium]